MNSNFIIILLLIILIIILVGIIIYFIFNKHKTKPTNMIPVPEITNDISLKDLMVQLRMISESSNIMFSKVNQFDKDVSNKMIELHENLKNIKESTTTLNEADKQAATTMSKLYENLMSIKETTSTFPEASKDIKAISQLYMDSKNRGNIGEIQLETILTNAFGSNKEIINFQQKVEGGVVDAVIKIGKDPNSWIYIDSKFNIVNWKKDSDDFKKDIRAAIDDLTKYKHEVFMFIPSEAIYSEICSYENNEIINYGMKRKIILTSPTILFYLLSLRSKIYENQQMAEKSEEIVKTLQRIFDNDNPKNLGSWIKWYNQWTEFINGWNKLTGQLKKINNAAINLHDDINDLKQDIPKSEGYKDVSDELKTINQSLDDISEDKDNK